MARVIITKRDNNGNNGEIVCEIFNGTSNICRFLYVFSRKVIEKNIFIRERLNRFLEALYPFRLYMFFKYFDFIFHSENYKTIYIPGSWPLTY